MKGKNSDPAAPSSSFVHTEERSPASLILLTYDADKCLLSAELEPSPAAHTASLESLRAQLQEAGYGEFYTSDEVLRPVILAANKAQTGRFVIAEQRDAALELKVSADKLTVHATAIRAYGGRPLSREWLESELETLGVPGRCVQHDVIAALVAAGEGDHIAVAQAVMPVKGADTRFEILVDGCKSLVLEEDEHGRVDFYQSHEFVVVDIGAPLMRRIPPTAGKMGINIAGNVLSPEAGKDIPFARDLQGAQISAGDHNLLVAAIKGHPIAAATSVKVDPTLRVKGVSLATGNVSFDGSVEIAGDVASGLSVEATGDIFIRGTVEKARVSARRNLIIQGGIIGDDLGRDENGELILSTRLRAGGSISAKFINLADVVAGLNISVREYVMQSHLHARGAILVGQESGKGSVIGGKAHAGEQLEANILGSDAYVPTEVRIGKENLKRRWLDRLKQAHKQSRHNAEQLQQLLAGAAGLTAEKATKVANTIAAQIDRQTRIQVIIERLQARQRSSFTHQINIKRTLHANVTLTIDGVTHISDIDTGPRCLVRSGAELITKNS